MDSKRYKNRAAETPPGTVEVIGRRNQFGKTFAHPDGRRTFRASITEPLHYRDSGTGQWEDIDPRWVSAPDGRFRSAGVVYQITTLTQGLGYRFEPSRGGTVEMELLEINDQPLSDYPLVGPRLHEHILRWQMPGCDIELILLPYRIIRRRVLHEALAPRRYRWHVRRSHAAKDVSRINLTLAGTDANRNGVIATAVVERMDETPGFEVFDVVEQWDGMVRVRDPVTRIPEPSPDVVYPVDLVPNTSDTITADSDDGHQISTYWYNIGYYFTSGRLSGSTYVHGGLRFLTVDVPQGATITAATITYEVQASTGSPSLRVYGGNENTASATWSNSNLPTNMPKTTAFAAISNPGTGVKTVNVASIVQEIVNRAGWVSGNHMRFAVIAQATAAYNYLTIWDYYSGATKKAVLDITYSVGGGAGHPAQRRLGLVQYGRAMAIGADGQKVF